MMNENATLALPVLLERQSIVNEDAVDTSEKKASEYDERINKEYIERNARILPFASFLVTSSVRHPQTYHESSLVSLLTLPCHSASAFPWTES